MIGSHAIASALVFVSSIGGPGKRQDPILGFDVNATRLPHVFIATYGGLGHSGFTSGELSIKL